MKPVRSIYSLCGLIFATLLAMPISAQTLHLTADEWQPFSGDKLLNKGIANDIVVNALKKGGMDADIKILPWTRALDSVKQNKMDGLTTVWYTDERAKTLLYSEPYLQNRVVFIKKVGSPFEYDGFKSLDGMKVGIIRDYGYGDAFYAAANFKRVPGNSLESNLKKVAAGRVDLSLDDEIVTQYTLGNEASLKNIKDKLAMTSKAYQEQGLHFAISHTHPQAQEIIDAFNKGLKMIKEDGTYEQIKKDHGLK